MLQPPEVPTFGEILVDVATSPPISYALIAMTLWLLYMLGQELHAWNVKRLDRLAASPQVVEIERQAAWVAREALRKHDAEFAAWLDNTVPLEEPWSVRDARDRQERMLADQRAAEERWAREEEAARLANVAKAKVNRGLEAVGKTLRTAVRFARETRCDLTGHVFVDEAPMCVHCFDAMKPRPKMVDEFGRPVRESATWHTEECNCMPCQGQRYVSWTDL